MFPFCFILFPLDLNFYHYISPTAILEVTYFCILLELSYNYNFLGIPCSCFVLFQVTFFAVLMKGVEMAVL